MILHIKDPNTKLHWSESEEWIKERCREYPNSPYVIYEDDGVTVIEAGDKLSDVF